MQTIEPEISVKVFISYARADQELRKMLEDHLSPLKHSGEITIWQDQELLARANREDQISASLNKADLILLLISASFIASKDCWNKEAQTALQRHDAGTAQVIPIILKPVDWQNTSLRQLQVLPTEAKPVTQWNDIDAALENVVRGVRKVVVHLRAKLREEALRKVKIERLTEEVADVSRSLTQVAESLGEIKDNLTEQEKRKGEIERDLWIVNRSIAKLKSQQDIDENEQNRLREQLKETSEQLVSLGGELDSVTSVALAPPFHLWGGASFQEVASNLDFAKGIEGWYLTGDAPQSYVYGIDPTMTLNGKACAYLKSRVGLRSVGFGTLAQAFQGKEYRGKRLRLSGLVKAQDVEQWAGLWMRIDGTGGKQLGFDNMSNRLIHGNIDVKKYSVVLDVSLDCVGIYFGIVLAGEGQVWLGDVQFEIVGIDVPTTDRS